MFRRPSIISDITTLRNSATSIPHDSHSSSSAMDQITPPTDRPLTPAEITTLQLTIRATLKLNNCSCALQAEEDATDLINYALDLISDGLSVGGIIEELEYMELEICGAGTLEEMRVALATSFVELEGQDRSVFASRPQDQDAGNDTSDNSAYGRRNSYQSRLRGSENHVTVDLSAKTAAAKKRQELASLSAQSSMSLKDRMKMFAEDGTLRGSYRNPCSGGVFNGDGDGYGDELFEEMDQEAFESQRQRDLTEIMNNVALSEREQTNKMKEVRAKYGVAEMKRKVARASHAKNNSDTANNNNTKINAKKDIINKKETVPRAEREMRKGRRSSVDLSAKSAVVKKCAELASLRRLGSSLKDRMGSMYSDDGNLKSSFVNNCNGDDDDDNILEEEVEKKKSVDELRREELFAVMRDKTLGREEKIQKMDEVRAKYAITEAETDDASASQSSEAASSQQQQQQQHAPGQARKEYMQEKRRKELQVIMRDRSLSKSMRKSKMDAVNTKYSSNTTSTTTSSSEQPQGTPSIIEKEQQHQDSPGSDEDGTVETAASSKVVSMDFSAKSYADRRRASLESLENSISSNDSDAINNGGEGRVKVMSLRERMSMYQNNEFVVKV